MNLFKNKIKEIMVWNNYSLKLKKIIFLVVIFLITGIKAFTQCPVEPDFNYNQYCDSLEFFNNSNVISGTIESVLWDFDDGSTATIPDPTHIYKTEGEYYVSLTLYHDSGCDTTITDTISYYYPLSNYTYSLGCCNDTSFFFDASQANSDSLISWSWDFDDGNFSSQKDPKNVFLNSGVYDVELIVTNNFGCTDDTTRQVMVENPIAGFMADTVCFGNSTQFSDTSTFLTVPVTEWFWDFGDGGTSTLQNPKHKFSTQGIHNVKLVVTDNTGCIDSTNHDILVNLLPVADFSFTLSCPGDTTYFYDQSVHNADSLISWFWDFDDGNFSTQKDPKNVFLNSGVYNVELIVTNNFGCTDDTTLQVMVEKPIAGFIADTVCFGIPTQFYDTSTISTVPITEWLWDFGDGDFDTIQNPAHLFSTEGSHNVKLKVTNEFGCTDSTIHDVLVDSLPVADFSYTTGCVGWETCFFDESIPNADSIFYRYWNFGDGNSSTLHNPCHIYTNPGQYEVVFVVINSNICVANTKIDTINVDYPPLAAFSASASCFNDTTYFVNETDTQGVEVQYWEWNFDDPASGVNNTSSLQTPEHLFTHEGMFNVELIVENIHGCIDTVINTILVDSLPEAHFLFPDTVAMGIVFLLVDSSLAHGSPIIIRHWDLGDGTTYSNLYQVYHSYSEPGEYEVCLAVTDYNGCSDTICQTIIVSAMPLADFDYTSDETLIANFYDESTPDTNIIDWFWDFGNPFTTDDTVSGIQNPIYYDYPTEGYYDVYLEISDKYGGTHDTTKQIYVGCAAIANFSYFDICLGDTTFFLDNSYSPVSAPIESWQWNFGDETDTVYYEQTDTITHYYDTSGVYNVELVIISNYNNNFVSDTILKEIRIYNLPSANFSSEGVCLGTETEFIDSSYSDIGNHITSWFWDFDDGYTGTVQNPIHKYNDVGEYNVFLEITTVHGCIDTITNKSYVSFAPDIPFHVENNCLNSPAYFIPDYDSTEIEITSWFWDFGDPYDDTTSTEPSPEHTYTRIMNYEVTMVASTYGCPKENKMSILVYPIPYSSFTLIPDYGDVQGRTKFTNQSIYADHYLWDFGNGNTSEVINPIEVYEEDSTYIVTLVSYNEYNCSDTSRLELLVFFNGLYFPTAFSPNNPNSEISRFTPKGVNLDEYQVQVFDLRGNLLWESDILDDTGSPVESWDGYYEGRLMPEGMYIWKASGLFKDGSVWKGSTFQSESPQTQGTVTLVR